MSKMKRVLAVFLALLMVVTCFPADVLADRTKTELDSGDITIEGNNSFGTMLSAELTDSQEENEGGYYILDLVFEENVATVNYSSLEDATLIVAVYTENGLQMLNSANAEVSHENTMATVVFDGNMPEYFMASAYLADNYDCSPLCENFETPMYTKEMQELRASTIYDYDEDKVLNLDDSNETNFAVYAEETIVIEYVEGYNNIITSDEENSLYVIENIDAQIASLVENNIFVYAYGENDILIVKVGSIVIEDTTATITGVEVTMEEAFAAVKIESAGDTQDLIVDESAELDGLEYVGITKNEEDEGTTFSARSDSVGIKDEFSSEYKIDKEIAGENLEITGMFKFSVDFSLDYYVSASKQFLSFTLNDSFEFSANVTGKLEKEFYLFPATIMPIPALEVGFKPAFKVELSAKCEIVVESTHTSGFCYDSKSGFKKIGSNPGFECDGLEVSGTFFIGFDLKPQVEVAGGVLAECELELPIGLEFEIENEGHQGNSVSATAQCRHACENCFDIETFFIFELGAKVKFLKCKWLTNEIKFKRFEVNLGHRYISIDHRKVGKGICPYLEYRTVVQVLDKSGKKVSAVEVKAKEQYETNLTHTSSTDKEGIALLYLPSNTYVFETDVDGEVLTFKTKINQARKIVLSTEACKSGNLINSGMLNPGEIVDYGEAIQYEIVTFNGHAYTLFSDVASTWEDAESYCESLGAHLATITSAEENEFLYNYMVSCDYYNAYWGLTDKYIEGHWEWCTGEPVEYLNWGRNEPNDDYNSSEDYGMYWDGVGAGQWNDGYFGGSGTAFLCEWETTDVVIDSENAPTLNSIFGGDYSAEVIDTYTLKKANFKDLVPKQNYILLAMKSIDAESLLSPGNLLYVDQKVALEDGTLEFKYVQREESDISYVIACGASNKNLSDAQITFPEMTADGELQVVNPTVVYAGETLSESQDYIIVGDTSFTEAGTYTCYIRGIHNYTGLVKCMYTVTVETAEIARGYSGDTTWILTDSGVLSFAGEGVMKNYTYKSEMPWYEYLDQITSVVIESGVTRVSDYAFYGAPNLESVSIPDTVTTIGNYTFKNAEKLDNVTLPSSLMKLGESAFYACTSLTSIEIPESLWTIQPYTFKNCTALTEVTFNEGNLQKISDGAFYNTGLTKVQLPDCLGILDVYTFKNCSNLEEIVIGSGLTELREAVFYGTAIDTIHIPEGITKVGPYAFKNCANLKTVELPSTLTNVGEASFYACTALESVRLPDAVTKIGNYAFRKCTGLTEVTFGTELIDIGESSFYGCTGLTELIIPEKVTTIQAYAFKGCTGVAAVTLPESLVTIGDSAFHTCTGLKTIVIPVNVETIGEYCFSGSYNLWKITFEGDAPTIGTGAFKGLAATAYYPSGNTTWTSDIMQNYGGTITWKAN